MCRMTSSKAMCLAAMLVVSAAHAQQVDRERFLDIEKLNEVVAAATESLAEPLRETKLTDRFAEVNSLLAADQVDKRVLVSALDGLESEPERTPILHPGARELPVQLHLVVNWTAELEKE